MQFEIMETTDDDLLAEFYHRHWLDMGSTAQDIAADWREKALTFMVNARSTKSFAGFCALSEAEPVGSACCQIVDRVYPAFHRRDALMVGYVWGVYVIPAHRGHGIGAALVQKSVAHLIRKGCGRVLLHASPEARPLYTRLGFRPTDELSLNALDVTQQR